MNPLQSEEKLSLGKQSWVYTFPNFYVGNSWGIVSLTRRRECTINTQLSGRGGVPAEPPPERSGAFGASVGRPRAGGWRGGFRLALFRRSGPPRARSGRAKDTDGRGEHGCKQKPGFFVLSGPEK
eukprot:gene6277-biopygen5862